MKRKKTIIAVFLLVSFLFFSTVLAAEWPCAFEGTIKVNNNLANGIYVTAHNDTDGKYLTKAIQPPKGKFGDYSITINNAAGSKIRLKYRNVFVNEPVQDCVSGDITYLDLTINCTDCDNDGYNYTVDCDESNANINPGAPELCNGIDDNCDGTIDNFTESCYTGPAGTLNNGICKVGIRTCTNVTWSSCSGEITPQTETCNGIDDNCDGSVDEGVCGGGHSPTTTVSNSGSNGGSGSGTNNVKTTTIITTTTVVPQTTTSNNETSNVNETTLITTTIPNTLGLTGLFLTDISSLGYWWILIIIMIVLLSILFIRKMNSNKNRPIEKSENETTTTNATENGPQ